MEILSAKDWYYDQLRKQSGKTMSHFELAENYSKYLLEQQERSYSEEEVFKMTNDFCFDWNYNYKGELSQKEYLIEWFNKFKKK